MSICNASNKLFRFFFIQLFGFSQPWMCRIALKAGSYSHPHHLAGISFILCVWSPVFKFLSTYSALTGFFSDLRLLNHTWFSAHIAPLQAPCDLWAPQARTLSWKIYIYIYKKNFTQTAIEMFEREQTRHKNDQLFWRCRGLLPAFIVYTRTNVSPLVSGECLLQPL